MIPSTGYMLPKWNMLYQYRSTALAYMVREGIYSVENVDGKWYTLEQIRAAIIGE